MAPKVRRRTYGNSHIAGHARVQLGDRQVTRNVKIEKAYIQLQNELELPNIEALVQALRIGASQIQPQVQNTNHGPNSWSRPENVRAEGLGSTDGCEHRLRGANALTTSDAARKSATPISDVEQNVESHECQKSRNSGSSDAIVATKTRSLSSKQSSLLRDSDGGENVSSNLQAWLSKTLSWLRLLGGLEVPIAQPSTSTEAPDTRQREYEGRLVNSNVSASAPNDMPMLLTAVLSYIVGQNLSVKDISDLLIMCQDRQLLGLLTCVIGVGLYRYFMMRHLIMAPSCPDKLIFEDAYGRTRAFSPDICADFDILTRFLEVHYRDTAGTTAGALVTAGQFHLMLGSRRGKVFSRRDWRDLVLKPGYKLVNSVYISKDNTECLTCQTTMIVTPLGEFHCPSCRTYHRDYDTIDPPVKVVTTPSVSNATTSVTTTVFPSPSKPESASTNTTERDDTPEDPLPEIAYDTSGLINLDLKLQPQRRYHTTLLNRARVKYTLSNGPNHLQIWQGALVTVLLENETDDFPANQWWLCEDDFGRQGYIPRRYLDIIVEESGVRILTAKWAQIVAKHDECARAGFGMPPPVPTSLQKTRDEQLESGTEDSDTGYEADTNDGLNDVESVASEASAVFRVANQRPYEETNVLLARHTDDSLNGPPEKPEISGVSSTVRTPRNTRSSISGDGTTVTAHEHGNTMPTAMRKELTEYRTGEMLNNIDVGSGKNLDNDPLEIRAPAKTLSISSSGTPKRSSSFPAVVASEERRARPEPRSKTQPKRVYYRRGPYVEQVADSRPPPTRYHGDDRVSYTGPREQFSRDYPADPSRQEIVNKKRRPIVIMDSRLEQPLRRDTAPLLQPPPLPSSRQLEHRPPTPLPPSPSLTSLLGPSSSTRSNPINIPKSRSSRRQ